MPYKKCLESPGSWQLATDEPSHNLRKYASDLMEALGYWTSPNRAMGNFATDQAAEMIWKYEFGSMSFNDAMRLGLRKPAEISSQLALQLLSATALSRLIWSIESHSDASANSGTAPNDSEKPPPIVFDLTRLGEPSLLHVDHSLIKTGLFSGIEIPPTSQPGSSLWLREGDLYVEALLPSTPDPGMRDTFERMGENGQFAYGFVTLHPVLAHRP